MPLGSSDSKILITSHGDEVSIYIEGTKKMLLCLPNTVRVLLKKDTLCLYGKELSCLSYGTGAIEVTGILEQLLFESKKEK